MGDCEKLSACAFFKEYSNNSELSLALKGFANMYCKGDKQEVCIRKKVSKLLGGADKVPVNMMPNGFPIRGTDDSNWSDDVKKIIG
jgi:hypothetical protein